MGANPGLQGRELFLVIEQVSSSGKLAPRNPRRRSGLNIRLLLKLNRSSYPIPVIRLSVRPHWNIAWVAYAFDGIPHDTRSLPRPY